MAAKPIPEGQHSITPYLAISNAAKAIEFYKQAFGATEMFRLEGRTAPSATPNCASVILR